MAIGGESSAVQRPFVRYASRGGMDLSVTGPSHCDATWRHRQPGSRFGVARCSLRSSIPASWTMSVRWIRPNGSSACGRPSRATSMPGSTSRASRRSSSGARSGSGTCGCSTRQTSDANVFHVTDEFTFSNGTPPDIRADIVFFVNGVPSSSCETKRATALDGIAAGAGRHPLLPPARAGVAGAESASRPDAPDPVLLRGDLEPVAQGAVQLAGRTVQAGDFETLFKTSSRPRRVLRVLTRFHPVHAQGRRALARSSCARTRCGPWSGASGGRADTRRSAGPDLAHPGHRQDLHHDHRRQAAHRGPASSRTPRC